jgi:hypothetical protein
MALTKIRGNTQIIDLSVTNTQIAFPDAANPLGILLAKIEDGSLLVKSDGSVPFTAPISGVAPTQAGHLVTKSYVDSVSTGLDVKVSVRAIATSPVVLSGTQSVDGVALVPGDRVLLTGQTNLAENGIYDVSAGAWTRSPDADNNPAGEVTSGMFTFIEEGSVYAGSGWVLTTPNPIALDTTPLYFSQFSSAGLIQAGAGLTKTGSVIDVVSANGGIVVSADAIALTLADSTLAITSSGIKLASLAQGQILIGDASGVATAQTLSGDVTVTAAGVTTISNNVITNNKISTGTIGLDKLVSAGGAGQIIITDASGVPSYVVVSGDVTIDAAGSVQIVAGSVGTPELADAAVTLAKLTTLTPANLIIGTPSGNASVTLSGDVTIDETGVVTINPATVVRVADIVKRENPTGNIDGTNFAYTVAFTPKVGTEDVYVNGVLQDSGAGNDYTISGSTITMLYALTAGDKIRVSYFK